MSKLFCVIGFLLVSVSVFARPLPGPTEANVRTLLEVFRSTLDDASVEDFDFSGIASLPGCSGSLVTFGQDETANAVIMTNGHCIGMMAGDPKEVIVNRPYAISVSLYVDRHTKVRTKSTRILYGLLQPHDVAFLELNQTYSQLAAKGIRARPISFSMARVGTRIAIASGYWNKIYTCRIEAIVHEIHEAGWVNTQSYKYYCNTAHGTSGSPVIDLATGDIVGVNYTGNDSGERCTMDNPCEVDESGNITVDKGAGYGDQVYKVMTCLNAAREIDLTVDGCTLPK